MKEKVIEKKIINLIEHRKSLWTAQIVLLGGIATIMVTMDSLVKIGLLFLGILLEILVVTSIRNTNTMLIKLYKNLEKI